MSTVYGRLISTPLGTLVICNCRSTRWHYSNREKKFKITQDDAIPTQKKKLNNSYCYDTTLKKLSKWRFNKYIFVIKKDFSEKLERILRNIVLKSLNHPNFFR